MNCKWEDFGEPDARGWRRVRCTRKACGITSAPTPHAHEQIYCTCKVWGWGDYLTVCLAMVGITSERLSWLLGRECECARRQESLNTWGEKCQAWFKRRLRSLSPS